VPPWSVDDAAEAPRELWTPAAGDTPTSDTDHELFAGSLFFGGLEE
jgi:hypothetical protein